MVAGVRGALLTAHLIYFTNSSWKTKYEVQTAKTGYACASVYYPRQHSKEWHEQPLLRAHTFMTVPYVVYKLTAWECAWDRRRPGRLLMFWHGWLFKLKAPLCSCAGQWDVATISDINSSIYQIQQSVWYMWNLEYDWINWWNQSSKCIKPSRFTQHIFLWVVFATQLHDGGQTLKLMRVLHVTYPIKNSEPMIQNVICLLKIILLAGLK